MRLAFPSPVLCLFLIVFNLRIYLSVSKAAKKEGLYAITDDVVILNKKNFETRVYGKDIVWVIEFYNSWCGHCIAYAPTFRKFASDVKGWKRVVNVGAVDCANESNLNICRDFDISAYPTIKFLAPCYKTSPNSNPVSAMEDRQPSKMKAYILQNITSPTYRVPRHWPSLSPLGSLGDIWDGVKGDHTFVAVVFETEGSLVGRQVILDVVDFPTVLVRSMLKEQVEQFGVITYPSLYLINKDSSFQHLASGSGTPESDRHRFTDKLLSMLGLFDSEGRRIKVNHDSRSADSKANQGKVVHFQQAPAESFNSSAQVHMTDLESALHYSLNQEIAICKTIEGAKLMALRTFVFTLAKYLPCRKEIVRFMWKVAGFMQRLNTSLTGETWVTSIQKLQHPGAYLPHRVQWAACAGSEPGYRGYPCGMWTLFHALTVSAYQRLTKVDGREVLVAIRGYMQHFFGCDQCSRNFLKMAAAVETQVQTPTDAVLWLWAAHNRANKRLHGDSTEDPRHPKVQFPPPALCPACHRNASAPGSWNQTAVLDFLVAMYDRHSIVKDGGVWQGGGIKVAPANRSKQDTPLDWWERRQGQADLDKLAWLMSKTRAAGGGKGPVVRLPPKPLGRALDSALARRSEPVGWGLSRTDIGLCMVFYFLCAAMLLFLYYHFVVRRKYRLPFANYLPV